MESRKECYECKYYNKCYINANYDSVYCITHKKYDLDKK